MTSRRIYRDCLDLNIVRNEFEKNKRIQFDSQITDVFLDILNNHYEQIEIIQERYK